MQQLTPTLKGRDLIRGMATLITRRSLCPVPARGRDASTRNLSNSSRLAPLTYERISCFVYVYLTVFLIFAINTWCNIWTSYSLDQKSDFSP